MAAVVAGASPSLSSRRTAVGTIHRRLAPASCVKATRRLRASGAWGQQLVEDAGPARGRAGRGMQCQAINALDSVMRMINQVVNLGDMFGQWEEESARADRARGVGAPVEGGEGREAVSPEEVQRARDERRRKSKWVSFRASGSSKALVAEDPLAGERGRGLVAYMCLPTEEYALLDPKYIARDEGAPQDGGAGYFCLRVPVQELTGLNLDTRAWVRVELQEEARCVLVTCERATLGAKDPTMDERFSVKMRSDISWRGPRRWGRWGEGGGGDEDSDSSDAEELGLACRTSVNVKVHVPPPLSAIPGPLLGAAGSLVLNAVVGGVLPQFLDLLAKDYKRWAAAEDREEAAGSLLPPSPPPDLLALGEEAEAESEAEAQTGGGGDRGSLPVVEGEAVGGGSAGGDVAQVPVVEAEVVGHQDVSEMAPSNSRL